MSKEVNYPKISIDPFPYISSTYGDKKKDKLWIMSNYNKNKNNGYATSVLIKKDGTKEVVWILGVIKKVNYEIDLPEVEKQLIIQRAYDFAKENNYLWK